MAQIAAWVGDAAPRLIVVDVSVEVAVLVPADGRPVVVMGDARRALRRRAPARLPAGGRDHRAVAGLGGRARPAAPHGGDKTHARRRDLALRRTAAEVAGRHGRRRPARPGASPAGAAPADDRPARPARAARDARLGLDGARPAGRPLGRRPVAAARAPPTSSSPTPGQNAIADVAAARRPAVVVPQERPHGEQPATARGAGRRGPRRRVLRAGPRRARGPACSTAAGAARRRRRGGGGRSGPAPPAAAARRRLLGEPA